MKRLIYVIFSIMLCSCPAYDPARGLLYISNDSDEAIYVYLKCGNVDLLPLVPKLELFHYFINDNMEDVHGNPIKPAFGSPEYRINAYTFGSIHILGTRNKPRLPCEENEVTLFFITEKTMRNYDWEEIYKNQMFVKKATISKEALENKNWQYTYSP